ncbi:MAG: hypothetical protein FWH37_04610 [Candidatus Bathyarchaeota archaeon]|nr:hypothetical protein [Candidatus Termiticorpusculum sp.]
MTKTEYLVERYAQTLTKQDVKLLFERLKKEHKGNVVEASNMANIQRKTVYDWDNNTDDVKLSTKKKILSANLQTNPYETIKFLVEKNANDYRELLGRYIAMLSDEIQSANTSKKINQLCPELNDLLLSHIGAIHDSKLIDIDDVISNVNEKCNSVGIKGITESITLFEPTAISAKIIQLLTLIGERSIFQCEQLSHKTGLPIDFVTEVCKLGNYTPINASLGALQRDYDSTETIKTVNDQ